MMRFSFDYPSPSTIERTRKRSTMKRRHLDDRRGRACRMCRFRMTDEKSIRPSAFSYTLESRVSWSILSLRKSTISLSLLLILLMITCLDVVVASSTSTGGGDVVPLASVPPPFFNNAARTFFGIIRTKKKRERSKFWRQHAVEDEELFQLSFPTFKSFPAMNLRSNRVRRRSRTTTGDNGSDEDIDESDCRIDDESFLRTCQEVSTKIHHRIKKRVIVPISSGVKSVISDGGFYGVTPTTVDRYYQSASSSSNTIPRPKKSPNMKDSMREALEELRLMRVEMEALRKELHEMKRKVTGEEGEEGGGEGGIEIGGGDPAQILQRRRQKQKRLKEFEKIAKDVEEWAEQLLFHEGDGNEETDAIAIDHGWTKIQCTNMLESTFNANGQTTAYLKWMKDSRGDKYAFKKNSGNGELDDREFPCLKVYSTIDAPSDVVCTYLSNKDNMYEYNDLLMSHQDLEVLSSNSKICLGRTPKILIVKPRDMITFCSHKWLKDGTELVVNQACDDWDENSSSKQVLTNPKAYALRGANYIGPHPKDPSKTIIRILCHASPGDDVPQWAARAAINSLCSVEPFKLFHKINSGVDKHRDELHRQCQILRTRMQEEMEMASTLTSTPSQQDGSNADGGGSSSDSSAETSSVPRVAGKKISRRPAGIAQLGYACFWPEGGGIEEGGVASRLFLQQQTHQGEADGSDSESKSKGQQSNSSTSSVQQESKQNNRPRSNAEPVPAVQ